jgi:hypothetical protein
MIVVVIGSLVLSIIGRRSLEIVVVWFYSFKKRERERRGVRGLGREELFMLPFKK